MQGMLGDMFVEKLCSQHEKQNILTRLGNTGHFSVHNQYHST